MKKLTLLPLIAATYCMVAGGPYGLEDLVGKTGYFGAITILLLTPLLWSLPTALMVSELASTLPKDGGFYAWVSRAMGKFWGFQEVWLTFAGSMFDMAIYPTLFAAYLTRLWPLLGNGHIPILLGLSMIVGCVIWNLSGIRAVGNGAIVVTVLAISPFLIILGYAIFHQPINSSPVNFQLSKVDIMGGI